MTLSLVLVLIVAACAAASTPQPSSTTSTLGTVTSTTGPMTTEREGRNPVDIDRPPPVEVRGDDEVITLEAWTACWGNGCYDGMPPADPPDIGKPDEIQVVFPASGWEFTATVVPVGVDCGRSQTEPLEPVGETTHRLMPIGLAGEYDVTLFGRGPGGDLFVTFRWTTTSDGVMPVPRATASILADHDGEIDSYGIEVPIWNLATTPESVSAEVTVTSAEGNQHTFELTSDDLGCSEGMVFLTAPIADGLTAAALGSAPFTYELELELDGKTYLGTATWPNDEDPECAPCVPLVFTPSLPAMTVDSARGITALQIDDVWVFHHDPLASDAALLGGSAEIREGCLYVDDTVVVWHIDRLDEVREIVAAVKTGAAREVVVGGGGLSLEEGALLEQLPEEIVERCPTTSVWFGSS